MCTHEYIIDASDDRVCCRCGLVDRHILDTNVQTFTNAHTYARRRYTRRDRFKRLLINLRGFQKIPDDVLDQCAKFRSMASLRSYLSEHQKKYTGSLTSIMRCLGYHVPYLSHVELTKCLLIFDTIPRKTSFVVLMPFCLNLVSRSDIAEFCKPVSKTLAMKYKPDLDLARSYFHVP